MPGSDRRAKATVLDPSDQYQCSKEELIGLIAPLLVGQLKRDMEELFEQESSSDAVKLARKGHERRMESTINTFGDTA
jgi:hypothetical protein